MRRRWCQPARLSRSAPLWTLGYLLWVVGWGQPESDIYIRANADSIPSYGERYRTGEIISSSFVESAINQVVSKRMVKRQQMRWAPRGAHLLLQVRTRVLNDALADDFHRWYPSFTHAQPDREDLAPVA